VSKYSNFGHLALSIANQAYRVFYDWYKNGLTSGSRSEVCERVLDGSGEDDAPDVVSEIGIAAQMTVVR
jgi:hypothetical protein